MSTEATQSCKAVFIPNGRETGFCGRSSGAVFIPAKTAFPSRRMAISHSGFFESAQKRFSIISVWKIRFPKLISRG